MEYLILLGIDGVFIVKVWKMMQNKEMLCHRKRERCYSFMRDKEWRICTRCLCINIGIALFPLVLYIVKQWDVSLFLLMVLSIVMQAPMIIDGMTQKFKKRKSNNFLRTVTGLISGIGLSIGISIFLIIGGY